MKDIILNNIEWLNDHSVEYLHYIITDNGLIWNIKKQKFKKIKLTKNEKTFIIYLQDPNGDYQFIYGADLFKWIWNKEFSDVIEDIKKTIDELKKQRGIKLVNDRNKPKENGGENKFSIGDIVYFKKYLINGEPLRHPYLILGLKNKPPEDWKYTLISLSSNIGASKVAMSKKVRNLTASNIIIKSYEAYGLKKSTMVRLTPKNCVLNVPQKEIIYGGKINNKEKITRSKNIFKQVLKKDTRDWANTKKEIWKGWNWKYGSGGEIKNKQYQDVIKKAKGE